MELNSFRIIAVRVFSYCDPAIMRALYPETTYFLNNDYEDEYLANARNLVYSLPFTVYGISKEELDKMSDKEVAVWRKDGSGTVQSDPESLPNSKELARS